MNGLKLLRGASLIFALSCAAGSASAAILASNGSQTDVQAKINLAADGDTVTLPAGTFAWKSRISISGKAIQLKGAGAGRVVGRIAAADPNGSDAVSVGTGTKVFALRNESVSSLAALRSEITPGRTLRISRLGPKLMDFAQLVVNNEPWMQGTVTSLIGNLLTMNITSSNGSGIHCMWTVSTMATTTILADQQPTESAIVSIDEAVSGSVEVSGIRFGHTAPWTGAYYTRRDLIIVNLVNGGQPVLLHDCYFDLASYCEILHFSTNRGVIWNCSFVAQVHAQSAVALMHKPSSIGAASWAANSTMGTADTTGKSNLYVEDCDFHAFLNSTDIDEGGRVTLRNCLFNNGGFGSHGADTSNIGMRHFEIYDSEFVYNGYNSSGVTQSCDMFRLMLIRGGTGVITGNVIPPFNGWDYGANGRSIHLVLWNLQRNDGPNPLWGKDISGIQLPCPRQIGYGRVTGTGVDGRGRNADQHAYVGDSEPLYIWGNTGGYTLDINPYGAQQPGEDHIFDYVKPGREFFNDGTAKPGWARFPYPHALRRAPRFVQITIASGS